MKCRYLCFQLHDGMWIWEDILGNLEIENTSGLLLGVYSLWNVFTGMVLIMYPPVPPPTTSRGKYLLLIVIQGQNISVLYPYNVVFTVSQIYIHIILLLFFMLLVYFFNTLLSHGNIPQWVFMADSPSFPGFALPQLSSALPVFISTISFSGQHTIELGGYFCFLCSSLILYLRFYGLLFPLPLSNYSVLSKYL